MRDETDLNGLKLAIDLKRGVDPEKLMQKLFKSTTLEDSFGCNFNFERTAEYLKYVDLSAFTSDEQVYDIDDVKAAFEMHLTSKYPKILIRCNKFDGE